MNTLTPTWPAPKSVRAYTLLRNHPSLRLPYVDSPRYLDFPQLQMDLSVPSEPCWIQQTHSTIVSQATESHQYQEADAIIANTANRVCVILTADCLPVLLCDRAGKHVAAIHAGWRGLANGIIENTIAKMNLPPDSLLAWLGPAIGPHAFEIRKDVYDIFMEKGATPACFHAVNQDQWLADIYALARLRLEAAGINAIFGGEYCTYTDKDKFFSYRREGTSAGRLASLIWIQNTSDLAA